MKPDAPRRRSVRLPLAALVSSLLAACGSPPPRPERAVDPAPATVPTEAAGRKESPATPARKPVLKRGGGFYKDDGPADEIPVDLDAVADPEPRWEPLHKGAQKPYVVLGRSYTPNTTVKPYRARGIASWYGKKFHGQKTSIGEPYDMFAMTAAHTTLALPSYVRVSNPENGRSVIVRVTDRGPFHADRIIDLSYTAAHKLGIVGSGSGLVDIEAIIPGEPTGTTYAQVGPPRTERPAEDELAALIGRVDKPDPVPAAAPASERGIWLQLGAFGNPENAESLRAHLSRELDWLTETPQSIQIHAAGAIQRVQVGPYRSRADAEKAAERIRGEFGTRPGFVSR